MADTPSISSTSTTSTAGTGVGGSVIDVQGLVSQLVAADRAPYAQHISDETSTVTTNISALATFKGALSDFETAVSKLKTAGSVATKGVTTSTDAGFTATSTAAAANGTYSVEVTQLAQAQQIASKPYTGGSTQVVGNGVLNIAVGGNASFSVTIDSSNNTLAGVRDAINNAAGNTGVQASLINSSDGSRLVLSSNNTGAANTIAVVAQGDAGLSALSYNSGNTANYTTVTAAQDASIKVSGFTVTSPTNTISNAIDGVTLKLNTAAPGTQQSFTVANDADSAAQAVQDFVTAYNAMQTQIAKLNSYDANTQTAGPMLGDTLLTGIMSQIQRTLSNPVQGVSGAYQTLSSIGVTTQSDGTLAVDPDKLQTALTNNFNAVGDIFSGANGVASTLDTQLNNALESGGVVDERSQNLVQQQKDIQTEQDDLDARMTQVQSTYLAQFTALDTLLSSLQTTSSFLTQQIATLPKPGGSSSS